MSKIEIPDHYGRDRYTGKAFEFDISFITDKRLHSTEYARYDIRLNVPGLKDGRVLGWIVRGESRKGRPTWDVRVSSGAFRGTDPTDVGDSLDKVPTHLTRSETDGAGHRPIEYGCPDRENAAYYLLCYLARNGSPIIPGNGPHPGVVTWESRFPASRFAH